MKTYYNTTYIGVIDLDTNEKQTRIVELEELDLSDWRKSFITELVKVAEINLDEFLAKSVAALATLLEPSFTGPKKRARQKTSKSSFGDLLLFWSYCLHRCVCVFVCVCVCSACCKLAPCILSGGNRQLGVTLDGSCTSRYAVQCTIYIHTSR